MKKKVVWKSGGGIEFQNNYKFNKRLIVKKIILFTLIICNLILHTTFLQAYDDNNINSFNIKIDNFEYTKLGIACITNNFKEVNELISFGANINFAKQDEYYIYDALYVTIESNSLEALTLLLKKI